MLSMNINGITRKAVDGTLSIADNINARSMASFSVDLTVESGDFLTVGQEVEIFDDATKIFAGTIDSYTLSYLRGGDTGKRRRYNVKCIDYNQITDRRIVAASYENQTVSFIINDIVTNFLSGEGITLGTIDNGSTVIRQAVFNYIKVSKAFDYIKSVLPSLNWNIDYEKELTFFLRETNLGANFDDSTALNITVDETRQQYINKVFVEAGDSTTETQVDEIPTPKPDGESKTFFVRFPIATKPTIKINGSPVLSSDIGILGLDTGKKWYWQKNNRGVTQDDSETTLIDTDNISLSYQGLKPIRVVSENPAGQNERSNVEGGTGIYEKNETQRSIDTKDGAQEYANGLLQKYGEIPKYINIESRTIRRSGQLINVTSDNLGLLEDVLITDVTIRHLSCGEIRYNIRGASGADIGSWVEFFRTLKEGQDLTIRENEVLVLLLDFSEIESHTGLATIKTFNALYPTDTLFPSNTLYPNGTVISEVVIND